MKELIYANWSYQIEKYLLLILALLDQPDPYIEEHCKCFGKKYCPYVEKRFQCFICIIGWNMKE